MARRGPPHGESALCAGARGRGGWVVAGGTRCAGDPAASSLLLLLLLLTQNAIPTLLARIPPFPRRAGATDPLPNALFLVGDPDPRATSADGGVDGDGRVLAGPVAVCVRVVVVLGAVGVAVLGLCGAGGAGCGGLGWGCELSADEEGGGGGGVGGWGEVG